jgi:ATP-dependent helicase/nuclease subunit B
MDRHEHLIPLARPFQEELARLLLGLEGLAGTLVILPARRACEDLAHALLEQSGLQALHLPGLHQPASLVEELAFRLGVDPVAPPPDELRQLILAQHLPDLDWARERSANTTGLGVELVAVFDELREWGRADLLRGADPATLPATLLGGTAGEVLIRDLQMVQEAWALYRSRIAWDRIDRLLAVGEALDRAERWPGPPWRRVVLAGFVEASPAVCALVRAVASHLELLVVRPDPQDPLSHLFLATYPEESIPSHPLWAEQTLADRIFRPDPRAVLFEPDVPLRDRLPPLAAELQRCERPPQVEMVVCGDPEDESRVVAGLVVQELAAHSAADGCAPRIAVATADTALARRFLAQLRDAGLAVDDSTGMPLAELPAGQLAIHLLRCAVTGLRGDHVLELLTHPFVDLLPNGRHARWALRFEKMIRRNAPGSAGVDGYLQRAREWDEAAAGLAGSGQDRHPMRDFVERLQRGLAPLLDQSERSRRWADHVAGLREAWARIAPADPLWSESPRQDQAELAELLARIESVSGLLPAIRLADFAPALIRLLSEAVVRPHRPEFLPVQVTGLVEARLARWDLLILAGLSAEVWPGHGSRPLFLGEGARQPLGLPDWRFHLGVRAESFLRLLHAGSAVIMTWPGEKAGEPCLPSPFLMRLGLTGLVPCTRAAPAPLYRRPEDMPPEGEIAAAQRTFMSEPATIPAGADLAMPAHLSHSSLQLYRDCPYRFLLERGFGLGEQEEVLAEFRHRDYGRLVHRCLQRFLAPGSAGARQLAGQDAASALRTLHEITAEVFGEGAGSLPERLLWRERLLAAAPDLVGAEIAHGTEGWRPRLLEASFSLPLARLWNWLAGRLEAALLPDLAPEISELALEGRIDRVDARTDSGQLLVIDYKTGAPPARTEVLGGRDLQLVLYALALLTGSLDAELGMAGSAVLGGGYYRIAAGGCGFASAGPDLDLQTTSGLGLLLDGGRQILEIARAAREPGRPFPLVPDHWQAEGQGRLPCGWCPFLAVCRLEERGMPAWLELAVRKLQRDRQRAGQRLP